MKAIGKILISSAIALCFALSAYAQDFIRLTERDLQGSARYVGMSGAMTAIGGDPSAVHDNPAGLGLYRHWEIMLTMEYGLDRTNQIGLPTTQGVNRFSIPQASVVFSFGNNNRFSDILFNNLMLSYQRRRTYRRSMYAEGYGQPSLGSLMLAEVGPLDIAYPTDPVNNSNALRVEETGVVDEFAINWAMNISDRWYVGAGIKTHRYSYSSDGLYNEQFDSCNTAGVHHSLRNSTAFILSGVGVSGAAGVIYRPSQWCRFGFSIETPSAGSLFMSSSGTLTAQTDSLRSSSVSLRDRANDFHMPLHTSVSAALQVYDKALIAFQYDYAYQQDKHDTHTLRAGLEIVPIYGMYINAGYAYEFGRYRQQVAGTYDHPVPLEPRFDRQDAYYQYRQGSHYASVGLGFRGEFVIVQAAYQYRWQHIHLYAHENVFQQPYDMNATTHRIVLTLAWHH